ncbi:4'-phosphopantetheinyl transferase [Marinomonas sp. FW-1]|uniref:4'-phosphopantetheinyl transferase family protein n=1 Tax=Marinomonas sp. FW-1 TaxID=2071621 RepID=UPI0010C01156|nr:4'-phosphopantetheinyl transferase superfamily protein [Marinomonas sp. FW-1]
MSRFDSAIDMENGFISQQGCLTAPLKASCSSIYWCRFDVSRYEADQAAMLDIAVPSSLNRAAPKRLAEFVAGRNCARQALYEYGARALPSIGDQRQPIWPNELWGSISHSDGIALAVVSPDLSIGLDIECIVSEKTVQDTSHLILTLTERNRFQGLLTPELYTLIFSVKESFYKAAFPYVQRFFDFSAIDVIDIQSEQQQLTYRINQRLTDDLTRDVTGQAYFSRPFPEHIMTFLALKTV